MASPARPRKPLNWVGGSRKSLDDTAAFPEAVYVLDVFVKKSTSGAKTPQVDKDRVLRRFKAARQHYDANHKKAER